MRCLISETIYDMDAIVSYVTLYTLRHDNELFSFSVSGWFLAHGTSCISTLIQKNSLSCHSLYSIEASCKSWATSRAYLLRLSDRKFGQSQAKLASSPGS